MFTLSDYFGQHERITKTKRHSISTEHDSITNSLEMHYIINYYIYISFPSPHSEAHNADSHATQALAVEVLINPFIAPACKISGLKDARTRLQTVHFPVL